MERIKNKWIGIMLIVGAALLAIGLIIACTYEKSYGGGVNIKQTKAEKVELVDNWTLKVPRSWEYVGIKFDVEKGITDVDFKALAKAGLNILLQNTKCSATVGMLCDAFLPQLLFNSTGTTSDTQKILDAIARVDKNVTEIKDMVSNLPQQVTDIVTQQVGQSEERVAISDVSNSINAAFTEAVGDWHYVYEELQKVDNQENPDIFDKEEQRLRLLTKGLDITNYGMGTINSGIDKAERNLYNLLTASYCVPSSTTIQDWTFANIVQERLRYAYIWEDESYTDYDVWMAALTDAYMEVYTMKVLSLQARLELMYRGYDTDDEVITNPITSLVEDELASVTGDYKTNSHLQNVMDTFIPDSIYTYRDSMKDFRHMWLKGAGQAVDCIYKADLEGVERPDIGNGKFGGGSSNGTCKYNMHDIWNVVFHEYNYNGGDHGCEDWDNSIEWAFYGELMREYACWARIDPNSRRNAHIADFNTAATIVNTVQGNSSCSVPKIIKSTSWNEPEGKDYIESSSSRYLVGPHDPYTRDGHQGGHWREGHNCSVHHDGLNWWGWHEMNDYYRYIPMSGVSGTNLDSIVTDFHMLRIDNQRDVDWCFGNTWMSYEWTRANTADLDGAFKWHIWLENNNIQNDDSLKFSIIQTELHPQWW